MPQKQEPSWLSIFSGKDQRSVQAARSGYSRKPNGSQDQGQKDEND